MHYRNPILERLVIAHDDQKLSEKPSLRATLKAARAMHDPCDMYDTASGKIRIVQRAAADGGWLIGCYSWCYCASEGLPISRWRKL